MITLSPDNTTPLARDLDEIRDHLRGVKALFDGCNQTDAMNLKILHDLTAVDLAASIHRTRERVATLADEGTTPISCACYDERRRALSYVGESSDVVREAIDLGGRITQAFEAMS